MATTVAIESDVFRRLVRFNLIAALAHAIQGVAVVLLATDFTLPVTATFLEGPPGTPPSAPARCSR